MKSTRAWLGGCIGILLIALAIYYWITPAESLPLFMPGHEAGVVSVHLKHGAAAFVLGILALIYAWFQTGTQA